MAENHQIPSAYVERFNQEGRERLARLSVEPASEPAAPPHAEGISCDELKTIADQLEQDGNLEGAAMARLAIAATELEVPPVHPVPTS